MKKLLFIIALGASTMIVLALAAYFELGPFNPAQEVRRMQVLMAQTETVNYKGGLSWSLDRADRTTSVLATGQLDFSHPFSIQHGTSFRVVNFGRDIESADTAGELIAVNEDTFIKFAQAGAVIDGVRISEADAWIRFDNPFGMSIKRAFLPSDQDGLKAVRAWSPESLPLLRALIAQADVLHITFDGVAEEVNGHQTRVFDARFDPDAARAFLLAVVRTRQGREPDNDERLAVESLVSYLEPMYVRLWIGMKDHLLYRLQATGIIPEERDRRALDIKLEFSDFNRPFKIQAPNAYQDFQSLSYIPADLPSALDIAPDERPGLAVATQDAQSLPLAGRERAQADPDPDRDGLDNTLEFFYGTDPNNPDTDGDGFSDGQEVLNGRNPKGQGSLFGFGLGG